MNGQSVKGTRSTTRGQDETMSRGNRMREQSEGRNDNGTDSPRRQARRGAESRAGRNDAGKELSPTCELADLLTCLLANLPTIFTMLSRRASRLPSRAYSYRSLISPAIPPRPHRILVSLGDTRGGAFFLIRSSHLPGSYSQHSAPFFPAHSFRHLAECM